MAETLSTVTQELITTLGQWLKIGNEHEFTATGGSATTAVNTSFNSLEEPPEEEDIKDGVLFVTKDSAGAGASPENRYGLISAYAVDTQTITHATVTDAIASGDKFKIFNQSVFPFSDVVGAINGGLRELGLFTFVDRSLTSAASQTEYSLPTGVVHLIGVAIHTSTDSNDRQPEWVEGVKITYPTTTLSTAPILYIPEQLSGYTFDIYYNGYHPTLSVYSDPIYPFLNKELVVAAAGEKLLRSYLNESGGQSVQHWQNMYNEFVRMKNEGEIKKPTLRMKPRRNRLLWPVLSGERVWEPEDFPPA